MSPTIQLLAERGDTGDDILM